MQNVVRFKKTETNQSRKIWRFQTWATAIGVTNNCELALHKWHLCTVFLPFLAVNGACIGSQSLQPVRWFVVLQFSDQDDIVSLLSKRVYDVAGSTLVPRQMTNMSVEIIQSCCLLGSSETIRHTLEASGSPRDLDGTHLELWFIPVGHWRAFPKSMASCCFFSLCSAEEKCGVHLNGEKLDIKNFRDYCDLYLPFWACLKHGFPKLAKRCITFLLKTCSWWWGPVAIELLHKAHKLIVL